MPHPHFSSVFSASELMNHLAAFGCDYQVDLHPNLVPYQGCDPVKNVLVRAANELNCLQKTIEKIDEKTAQIKANRAFVQE
jgi:hypothetical protein